MNEASEQAGPATVAGQAPVAEQAAQGPSEWDQTVQELTKSAQDSVGMVAEAAGKAGEALGPTLDALGAVVEVGVRWWRWWRWWRRLWMR